MSRTADYKANEGTLLKAERDALLADIEKFRAQRKDEKRFLDIDAETKKLAELKADIEAALVAGREEAERIKAEAKQAAEQAMNRAKDEVATANITVTELWNKLAVGQDSLKREWDVYFAAKDELSKSQTALASDKAVFEKAKEKAKAIIAAHKENLESVEF